MTDTDNTPAGNYSQGPKAQGGPIACAVLMAINAWNVPVSSAEIKRMAGLPDGKLKEALRGLRERGMIESYGRGTHARWVLTRWVRERHPDVIGLVVRQQVNEGVEA